MPNGRRGRGVRAARAITAFQKMGFTFQRQSGSHVILSRHDGAQVIIPRHHTVKPGLILGQLKRVGISWEQFEDAL